MPVKVTISRRERPGSTLIELLVVTAIIGMLISLLFPAMRARTTNARRARFTIFLLAGLLAAAFTASCLPDPIQAADFPAAGPGAVGNLREPGVTVARIVPRGFDTRPPAGSEPASLVAPFGQSQAGAAIKAWAQSRQINERWKNSHGMDLILIPPGEFRMGSEETYAELVERFPYVKEFAEKNPAWKTALLSDRPQHKVRIASPFYFGVYEVTKAQFKKFVQDTSYRTDAEKDGRGGWGYDARRDPSKGEDPLYRSPNFNWRHWGVDQSDGSPVVNVSWNDATAFCEWLSKKEGKKYRLPREAEWEYACRAGTTSRYYNGDDPARLTRIGNVADATAKTQFPWWASCESSDGWAFTSPVGQFQANNFGLYDMIGNAAEWCQDWFGELYYRDSPETDPSGPPVSSYRVIRGGGWSNRDVGCRSARRYNDVPTYRNHYLGFRVVCEP